MEDIMWDTNINNEIYNIFAKIYLFFNKIDEVKKSVPRVKFD